MAKSSFQKIFVIFTLSLASFLLPSHAFALERWVVGNKEHPWQSIFKLTGLEVTESGSIQSMNVSGENLSLGILERGGWIRSSKKGFGEADLVAGINGDHTNGWGCAKWKWKRGRAKEEDIHGERHFTDQYKDITVIMDLGAPFGVDSLSFYTREGFEDRFVKGYEIFVNDGSQVFTPPPPRKLLGMWKGGWRYELWHSWYPLIKDWKLVAREKEVGKDVSSAEISIPLQTVRYIAFSDSVSLPDTTGGWEIDEFEVWGEGFAMAGQALSEVIDLGQMSNFRNLKWSATLDPGTSITIRTRTGKTPDPYVYHELTGLGLTGQKEVSSERYYNLPENRRGSVRLDTENWSFWSAPYPLSGDEPMLSPDPARYVQFKIEFQSNSPLAKVKIDSLSLEYSEPLLAREVIGEISPQEIHPGKVNTFKYALLAIFEPENTGFDGLRVFTPAEVDKNTIRDLEINGSPIKFSKEVGKDRDRHWFELRFPNNKIPKRKVTGTDSVRIEFSFDCEAFVYGTRFLAEVFDTQAMEAPQDVVPGDASPQLDNNKLLVKWPLGGNLIANVKASPNPLTPNNDGTGDTLTISYSLLQLTEPAPVSITLYNLSGSPIWHYKGRQANGSYSIPWNGKDGDGKLVPPGLYVYKITVEAGTSTYNHTGTISVVY